MPERVRRERDPLAHLERRSRVIEAEGVEGHKAVSRVGRPHFSVLAMAFSGKTLISVRKDHDDKVGSFSASRLDELLFSAQPAHEMRPCGRGLPLQEIVGVVARLLDQRDVMLEIREAQERRARLPRPQEFAWPAYDEILAGDLEAVVRL